MENLIRKQQIIKNINNILDIQSKIEKDIMSLRKKDVNKLRELLLKFHSYEVDKESYEYELSKCFMEECSHPILYFHGCEKRSDYDFASNYFTCLECGLLSDDFIFDEVSNRIVCSSITLSPGDVTFVQMLYDKYKRNDLSDLELIELIDNDVLIGLKNK